MTGATYSPQAGVSKSSLFDRTMKRLGQAFCFHHNELYRGIDRLGRRFYLYCPHCGYETAGVKIDADTHL